MFNCNFSYYFSNHKINNSNSLRVDFNLKKNSILALTGKNGSGKTTILKLISGLLVPNKGTIIYSNIEWFNSNTKRHLPTKKRDIGFVFQDNTLLPFLTIKKNFSYATKYPNKDILNKLIEITKLNNLLNKYPYELSGGQKQKAMIIQSLIRNPKLLLLDEAFSNLDNQSIYDLQNYIKELQNTFNFPIIISTHSKHDINNFANQVYKLF